MLNFNVLQFLMPEDSPNKGQIPAFGKAAISGAWLQQSKSFNKDLRNQWAEGDAGGRHVASCACLVVGQDTLACLKLLPLLPLSPLGRSCTDATSLSGSKETWYQVPVAQQGDEKFGVSFLLAGPEGWQSMKPPVLKSTQTGDSREDDASVPVNGHSPGTRTRNKD